MKQRKLIGQQRGLVVIYYTGGTLSIKVPFGPLLFKDELKLPHLPRPQIVLSLLVSLTLSYHFGVQLLVFFLPMHVVFCLCPVCTSQSNSR